MKKSLFVSIYFTFIFYQAAITYEFNDVFYFVLNTKK